MRESSWLAGVFKGDGGGSMESYTALSGNNPDLIHHPLNRPLRGVKSLRTTSPS